MRLNNYLTERIMTGDNFINESKMFDLTFKRMKSLGILNDQIVWRGFNSGKTHGSIFLIKNDRVGFKGKMFDKVNQVIDGLKMKYQPIFTVKGYNAARFFGSPRIVVPGDDFISYFNPEVDDLAGLGMVFDPGKTSGSFVDVDIDSIIDGYSDTKEGIPNTPESHEIIISCSEYYLINPGQMIGKSKFGKIKNVKDIKIYGDIIQLYSEYVAYIKWFVKMRLGENPNLLDYYKKNYPEEWFT